MIFYWGVKKTFDKLDLHNILFSENYQDEFDQIFNRGRISSDPTIYINITSKDIPEDAPLGCENWFVMVNAPHDQGQNWDEMGQELSSWTLETSSKGFQTLRIFLDRSRPPQLNFYLDQTSPNKLENKSDFFMKKTNGL